MRLVCLKLEFLPQERNESGTTVLNLLPTQMGLWVGLGSSMAPFALCFQKLLKEIKVCAGASPRRANLPPQFIRP